jgi:hypothetical protein
MNTPLRISLRLFLAGTLAALVLGCAGRPKPMQFINRMARANSRLAAAAKDFEKKISPLSGGQPVNPSEVRSSYSQLENALGDARKEADKLKPPIGPSTGPELLAKYRDYIDGQQKLFDNYVKQIMTIVEGPADPPAKWGQIKPLLDKLAQEAGTSYSALQEAQTAYAKEQNLRLVN